jgi:hypothetical protein
MQSDRDRPFGLAWIGLALALALHVADEATHDFLSLYNPTILAIRRRLPWAPLPVFTFGTWLGGLIVGICLLLALSPFAFERRRWLVPLAWALGIIMFLNGSLHLLGSLYLGRMMPGAWSSPLLLIASACLLTTLARGRRTGAQSVEGARNT